jgi:TRAP-type uncharacterized transport system substrate-binding protein
MAARDVLRNHWPAITITVTAAAIACAAVVVLRSMPPRTIVMATGPAGGAYSEVGKLYRAALGDEVEVRLVQTAGSPENLALLLDPHSGVSVALIQGGTVGAENTSELESLGRHSTEQRCAAVLQIWPAIPAQLFSVLDGGADRQAHRPDSDFGRALPDNEISASPL